MCMCVYSVCMFVCLQCVYVCICVFLHMKVNLSGAVYLSFEIVSLIDLGLIK